MRLLERFANRLRELLRTSARDGGTDSAFLAHMFSIEMVAEQDATGRVKQLYEQIKEVVVRPMLPLTAIVDHRVIDGFQAGHLCATFEQILRDPATHFDRTERGAEVVGEQNRDVVKPVCA